MSNIRKINYIGISVIVSMIIYIIIMNLLNYKIAFRFSDTMGKDDTVYLLLIVALGFWIFMLSLIEYKGKYFFIQFIVVSGVYFIVFAVYILMNFWGDTRIMIHETPFDDKLLFYSEYQGGGLHHARFETTIYQKVTPFTYNEIGVIGDFDSFLQIVTIESDDWFKIEYKDSGFTIILDYYDNGEQIYTEQYFEYID